ncbi:MAG: DUF664 domain-containing protein [Chloroflexi bacterium]|nr:DUF664 domain-containing protein [Chloroflexota bacterium]
MMLPEVETYVARLRDLRQKTLAALEGMNQSALNWKPLRQDTNSPFVLATHLIGSERHWIQRVVGQRTITRDRDAEFRARGDSLDALRAEYGETARVSEEILARLTDAELNASRVTPNYGTVSARWSVLHMIEHYSEHVGQIQLTRQMWEANAKVKSKRRKQNEQMTNDR